MKVRNGDPEIADSTKPNLDSKEMSTDVVSQAIETGETVRRTGPEAGVTEDSYGKL